MYVTGKRKADWKGRSDRPTVVGAVSEHRGRFHTPGSRDPYSAQGQNQSPFYPLAIRDPITL